MLDHYKLHTCDFFVISEICKCAYVNKCRLSKPYHLKMFGTRLMCHSVYY